MSINQIESFSRAKKPLLFVNLREHVIPACFEIEYRYCFSNFIENAISGFETENRFLNFIGGIVNAIVFKILKKIT